MKYIDTHAHLTSEFYKTRKEAVRVYQDAVDAGVTTIINVASDMTSSRMVINDQPHMPLTYPTVGIHPLDLELEEIDYDELLKLAKNKNVIAIGEIGIDLSRSDGPSLLVQKTHLMKQFDIALKVNKPVLIHVREAINEILDILYNPKYKHLTGLIHTFSGTVEEAHQFIKLGFKLSFSGVVTFKNAQQMRDVVSAIPLTAILSETDSPFLTPVPKRGKRNEPKNVLFVVRELAKIKDISVSDMVNNIARNTQELFNIE